MPIMTDPLAPPIAAPAAVPAAGVEFGILDVLIVLAKYKYVSLGLPLLIAALTYLATYLFTPVYTGLARVLPPQQSSSAASMMLGQLGGLAGGLGQSLGLKNPGDVYVGMLNGNTIADRIIERFGLRNRYDQPTLIDTRIALGKLTWITAKKDGIIQIEVDDPDPQKAADLTNAYVEELERLTEGLAMTDGAQRRGFFQKLVDKAKEDLAGAEHAMQKMQERTGMVKLEEQGRAIIEFIASLKAQIMAKEIQVTSIRSFGTDQNPEVKRAQDEIASMRVQLQGLERKGARLESSGILVPIGKVPEVGLEYVRAYREVKYQEAVFEILAKQFEMAKIDAAKDVQLVQVIDRASAPDKKSKPRRVLITVLGYILALIGVLAWMFSREKRLRATHDPSQAHRYRLLRQYLFGNPHHNAEI